MAGYSFTLVGGYFVTAAWTAVNIVILILCILLPLAGAIVLQVYLSKKENRWPGLLLPILFFIPSLIITSVFLLRSISGGVGATLGSALLVFIICNIPTAILLVIYTVIRGPRKNKNEIDKMNIQDLS